MPHPGTVTGPSTSAIGRSLVSLSQILLGSDPARSAPLASLPEAP